MYRESELWNILENGYSDRSKIFEVWGWNKAIVASLSPATIKNAGKIMSMHKVLKSLTCIRNFFKMSQYKC